MEIVMKRKNMPGKMTTHKMMKLKGEDNVKLTD